MRRYTAGYASYYEVVAAQYTELSTKLEREETRYKRMNATLSLVRALGGGWQAQRIVTLPLRGGAARSRQVVS